MKTTRFAAAASLCLFLSLLPVFSPVQAGQSGGQEEDEDGGKYRGLDIRSGVETDKRCIPKNGGEGCLNALEKFCQDFSSLSSSDGCKKPKSKSGSGGW